MLRRAYHETVAWAAELIAETPDLDDDTRRLTQLHLTQISAALSPSNFIATNPDLLRETMRERGANLVRGARMLAEDLEAGRGVLKIRQSDSTSFELGVNIASTPGTVIFRNELIELIQYAPATPGVRRRPLLIVPSWINKFYILDLTPEKSFVRWAVSQGLTVFIISWVNPDERHGAKRFDDYLVDGLFAALGAVEAETGERRVDVAGYCVGGTLVAAGAAHEAAAGENRIASLTLLAAQVDFSAAGDLKALFDEAKVRLLEDRMYARGFLEGTDMASAFNMLRPNDLIWSYVVNVYLKGQPPTAFDLLHWNSDSTRIPAANHAFYLRRCYLENSLARGLMVLAGERLDLARVTIPIYCLATREDHIAPARSVFIGAQCFGSEVVFVLAGSGHIAGVVNPPAKQKYEYWTGPVPTGAVPSMPSTG
jgi:polyhydroxyalkanoate synthase